MVYCSGLESQCWNPQETAENAQICHNCGAPLAMFTQGSADADGARVGTQKTNTGTYEALKRAGHSPAKAAEIMLDAKRGENYARRWIAAVAGDLSNQEQA